MNNKDKLFLAGFQESMREFIAADIGKAAKADLAAIEKASGGKKKLAEADKILTDAGKAYAKRIAEADKRSREIVAEAKIEAKEINEGLVDVAERLDRQKTDLEKQNEGSRLKSLELENAALALKNREKVADKRAADLVSREAEIKSREKEAFMREAEIKRYDDWRAAAPA